MFLFLLAAFFSLSASAEANTLRPLTASTFLLQCSHNGMNDIVSAAWPPAPAKNARTGHPELWCRKGKQLQMLGDRLRSPSEIRMMLLADRPTRTYNLTTSDLLLCLAAHPEGTR